MSREIPEFREILAKYQLHYESVKFIRFETVPSVEIPEWFEAELDFGLMHRGDIDKEAFTAEFIIVPFLKEVWKRHTHLNLFSHVRISADDITVIPDYLVSAQDSTGYKTLSTPLLLTVEAKNDNFDEGWAQALLQAVICQKINGNADIPIHAIVTTGDLWQFGRLSGTLFRKHPLSASIQDIEKLLGILNTLFSECEKAITPS